MVDSTLSVPFEGGHVGMTQGGCGVKNQLLSCGRERDVSSLDLEYRAGAYRVIGVEEHRGEAQRHDQEPVGQMRSCRRFSAIKTELRLLRSCFARTARRRRQVKYAAADVPDLRSEASHIILTAPVCW